MQSPDVSYKALRDPLLFTEARSALAKVKLARLQPAFSREPSQREAPAIARVSSLCKCVHALSTDSTKTLRWNVVMMMMMMMINVSGLAFRASKDSRASRHMNRAFCESSSAIKKQSSVLRSRRGLKHIAAVVL